MPRTRRKFLADSASAAAGTLILNAVVSPNAVNAQNSETGSSSTLDSMPKIPAVSPYLEEVLNFLDPAHPTLAQFLEKAQTPLEKQEAILAAYRNRKLPSIYGLFNDCEPEKIVGTRGYGGKEPQKTAELALQHIFHGQPAYEPDFRGKDKIDWDTNPHKDKEWLWQFHRFSWLTALTGEYVRTKDEKFAREWVFEMRSWTRHMHKPENAFHHPGWRSLDTALRMKEWALHLEFFLQSPSLDSRTFTDFLYSLDVHCRRILKCCLDAQKRDGMLGNWDIYHTEGLLFTAAALPERKESAREVQTAAQLLVDFQKRVLLEDGVINEYIPSYHMAYPAQFARLVRVCGKLDLPVEIPQDFMDRLEKSINAVVVWSHPDGAAPVFGDAWLGSRDVNRRWIRPYLTMFDRPDWVWFVTKGKEGRHPDSRIQELPAAGYHTMRSDWSENALFLVAKNSNTTRFGHNQADNMTFELSAFGRRLMIDSGCFNYSGEPEWRRYFRSPEVHQLVSLDKKPILSRGRKIGEKTLAATETRPAADILILENEPVPGLFHRRTFQLIDGRFFVILDELSGQAAGELRQHFQLLPGDWRFEKEQQRAWTVHPGKVDLLIAGAVIPNAEISLQEEEGWLSTVYMKKERRPAMAFVQKKAAGETRRFATLLYPIEQNETLDPGTLHFTQEENSSAWTLTLGEKNWKFGYEI